MGKTTTFRNDSYSDDMDKEDIVKDGVEVKEGHEASDHKDESNTMQGGERQRDHVGQQGTLDDCNLVQGVGNVWPMHSNDLLIAILLRRGSMLRTLLILMELRSLFRMEVVWCRIRIGPLIQSC